MTPGKHFPIAGDEETRQLLTEILRLQREASRKRWKLLLIIATSQPFCARRRNRGNHCCSLADA